MSFSCPIHGYYEPRPGTTLVMCPQCSPGIDTLERVSGTKPILVEGERDCPTCRGTGINPVNTMWLCPKCNGERKVVNPKENA